MSFYDEGAGQVHGLAIRFIVLRYDFIGLKAPLHYATVQALRQSKQKFKLTTMS